MLKKAGYFVCLGDLDAEVNCESLRMAGWADIANPDGIDRARGRAVLYAEEKPGSTVVVYEVIFKPVVIVKSEVVVTQSNVGLDEVAE